MNKNNLYEEELRKQNQNRNANNTLAQVNEGENDYMGAQRENYSQPSQNSQPAQASQPNTASVAPVSQPTQNVQPTQTPRVSQPTVQQPSTPQYSSQWQSELDNLMSQIMNREKFSFDLNGDAMYQQYADMYKNNADMAMENAMGQAAAMTGGYGSSYSQAAGQQAYAQQMQGLNNVAMEMYNNALNRYLAEGDALNQQYSMMASREAQDYQRYLDSLAQTNYENEMAYNQSRDEIGDAQWRESFDYQQAMDQLAQDNWNRQFAASEEQRQYENAYNDAVFDYQKERDDVVDSQWQAELNRLLANDATANEQWDKQFAEVQAQNAADNQYRNNALAQDNAQYLASLGEDQRQFNHLYGDNGFYDQQNAQAQDNWQASFDREGEQWDALYGEGGINNPKFEGNFMYDADGNLRDGYTTTNTNLFDESGNFKQASIAQTIQGEDGKSGYIEWNVGGKTIKLQAGYNPYTQTKNPDVKNGTFGDGGYQPDNVASHYDGDTNVGKLTPTALEQLEVNGVWQTVYKDNAGKDSRYWVWDDANNEYIDVTEQMKEENPEHPLEPNKGNTSASAGKGSGGGKSTFDRVAAVNR